MVTVVMIHTAEQGEEMAEAMAREEDEEDEDEEEEEEAEHWTKTLQPQTDGWGKKTGNKSCIDENHDFSQKNHDFLWKILIVYENHDVSRKKRVISNEYHEFSMQNHDVS